MYKVLLVDDEIWALRGLEKTFEWEKYGFEIIGKTTSATECWEMIKREKPDVVFADVRMPVLSGLELSRKAQEMGLCTVFVMVSGFGDFKYLQQAIRNRVFDYCLKPIDRDEGVKLLTRLSRHLDEQAPLLVMDKDDEWKNIKNESFRQILLYIQEHYDEKLMLKDLSVRFYINEKYCCALFNRYLNTSFSRYINGIRIEKAIELMKNDSSLTGEKIAELTGYGSYYHFSKMFKRVTGKSFFQLRQEIQGDAK